jgi:hypothetical protein
MHINSSSVGWNGTMRLVVVAVAVEVVVVEERVQVVVRRRS